jgi:glycosyltransferase involved in cell wall biosynthesis
MRLLMLSWRGPAHPAAGGAEAYTACVLRELVRRGHSATWFCEGPAGDCDGVRVVAGGPAPGVYLAGRRFLRRHRRAFDLVIDQINVSGFLTPLGSPLPVLALIHQRAGEIWRYDPSPVRRRLGPSLERALLRPYRRVPFVTVSQTTLADLRGRGWRGRAHIAYNGVAASDGPHPRKEPQPTLAFLGRWQAPGKRLEDALAVHRLVRAQLPQAQLWVIGRGDPPPQADDGVRFFPQVDDAQRDDLLARSWLLIATSAREGWGRMVLEAAARGTPCAVYGSPGLAESAVAVEGTVTNPDPISLAAAVGELLRAPGRLAQRGERAAQLAADFTWERAADVWETALAATLERAPGR